jgi:hypothetical protein
MGLLVYIFDEQTGRGVLDLVRPIDVFQIVLHPDEAHLMVRRASGEQPIEIYDLRSGNLEQSIIPTLPDFDGAQLLEFNQTGDEILSHFQRFDAETGTLLNEDLTYHPGFEQFYFSDDSQSLITRNGSIWWEWDLELQQVVRRERVNLRGEVLRASLDDRRYLLRLQDGVELVDIGADSRRSVTFEQLPGRDISQIIASPNWEDYFVIYSTNEYLPHYPGNEVALYNLYDGLQWLIAGSDLPSPDGRDYGWLDDGMVYVVGSGGGSQPERIYGLDYHPSGLPQCLVDAFPEEWTGWEDLWERLNARLQADDLGHLTQDLCAALPGTMEDVEDVFFPSPTPTRIPVSPTPSFIAGVPGCLTAAFPGEGLSYAQDWRALVVNMTPEEVANLETLLCEGLQQGVNIPPANVPFVEETAREVMLIDIATGLRSQGTFLPRTPRTVLNRELVLEEFIDTEGFNPDVALLSPNAELFAILTPSQHIAIYRLVRTYDDLLAELRATQQVREEDAPERIALAPTATAPFERLDLPQPTLTPTVTPTSPPPPEALVNQPRHGEVVELCNTPDTLFDITAPPPNYAPSGRILAWHATNQFINVFDPAIGESRIDETLISPENGQLSFDQNWLLLQGRSIVVARPDGTDARELFAAEEAPVQPEQVYWLDPDTVEYVYRGYIPDRFANAVSLLRQYNVETDTLGDPFMLPDTIEVNELPTATLATQPGRGPLALVATQFNAGSSVGQKFYIYDRETGVADYFARLTGGESLEYVWHPLGRELYYRYPSDMDWYSFDAETREHRLLGELPSGQWSRDGRYRVRWFNLTTEAMDDREKEGLPFPKLSIWDSETGLTRQYCIPQTERASIETRLLWSPDSRYLAFLMVLPADQGQEVFRPRALILDTETGSVTELTFDINQMIVWME